MGDIYSGFCENVVFMPLSFFGLYPLSSSFYILHSFIFSSKNRFGQLLDSV